MNTTAPASFTIGVLARETGVAIDTIRFYEKEGLLAPVRRRDSGYREYDRGAVERLGFIRRAKELGFSLEEIRELAALENDREHGVEGVRQRALLRLAEIDRRLARMVEIRESLARLVAACPGHGEPGECPILLDIHSGGDTSAACDCADPPGATVVARNKAELS